MSQCETSGNNAKGISVVLLVSITAYMEKAHETFADYLSNHSDNTKLLGCVRLI